MGKVMYWQRYGYNDLWLDKLVATPLRYYGSWNLVNSNNQTVGLNIRPIAIFQKDRIWASLTNNFYYLKSEKFLLGSKSFFGDLLD
jgi:hypothetical protein